MMDDFGNAVQFGTIQAHYRNMLWAQIYFFYGAALGRDSHVIASENPL